MKKNSFISSAVSSTLIAFLIAGVFTSCSNNNTPDKSSTDSTKMQPPADSTKPMNGTTIPMKDTPTKSGQTPPPKM